jgi:hypothetical protein
LLFRKHHVAKEEKKRTYRNIFSKKRSNAPTHAHYSSPMKREKNYK